MANADARVFVKRSMLASLLRLPADWRLGAVHDTGEIVLSFDVVFPDGPSGLGEPIGLTPQYRYDELGGVSLTAIEPIAFPQDPRA